MNSFFYQKQAVSKEKSSTFGLKPRTLFMVADFVPVIPFAKQTVLVLRSCSFTILSFQATETILIVTQNPGSFLEFHSLFLQSSHKKKNFGLSTILLLGLVSKL
jgi:hypothetical protein